MLHVCMYIHTFIHTVSTQTLRPETQYVTQYVMYSIMYSTLHTVSMLYTVHTITADILYTVCMYSIIISWVYTVEPADHPP
jgi:hypothetical protein